MVLYVQGKQLVSQRPTNSVELGLLLQRALLSHEWLIKQAERFTAEPPLLVSEAVSSGRSLYVNQRERATCLANRVDVLGSGDATTCIIVFLRSPRSWKASCAHFDGAKHQVQLRQLEPCPPFPRCSLRSMLSSFDADELSYGLELSLVGGYDDGSDDPAQLLRDILVVLQTSRVRFTVLNAAVNILNTTLTHVASSGERSVQEKEEEEEEEVVEEEEKEKDPHAHTASTLIAVNAPVVRGAAVEMKTGRVCPASFAYRGPEMPLRSARSFMGAAQLEVPYDTQQDMLSFGPFEYNTCSPGDAQMLQELDPIELLHCLSTSPLVEAPHFVSDMRETLKFVRAYPLSGQYFKGGKAKVYRREVAEQSCRWVPVSAVAGTVLKRGGTLNSGTSEQGVAEQLDKGLSSASPSVRPTQQPQSSTGDKPSSVESTVVAMSGEQDNSHNVAADDNSSATEIR